MVSYTTVSSSSTIGFNGGEKGLCGMCSPSPSTKRGQRIRMAQMIMMIFIPIIGIACYAFNDLIVAVNNVGEQ